MSVSYECCGLSGRGVYVWLISRLEESYRERQCVCVCARARARVCDRKSLDNEEALAQ
jgi:hypothetical protein